MLSTPTVMFFQTRSVPVAGLYWKGLTRTVIPRIERMMYGSERAPTSAGQKAFWSYTESKVYGTSDGFTVRTMLPLEGTMSMPWMSS